MLSAVVSIQRSVAGHDRALRGEADHVFGDLGGVVQDSSGLAAGDQGSVGVVRAVRERLRDAAQAGGLGLGEGEGTRKEQQRQVRPERLHRVDDGLGVRLVVDDRVVEGPVRLDVAHLSPVGPGQGLEAADLVEDVVGQFGGGTVQEPAPEARQVPVSHVGADDDAGGDGVPARPGDGRGSPAWKPHATLALETDPKIAASSPMLQLPKDSPTSLFRSMNGMVIPVSWCFSSRMHQKPRLFNNIGHAGEIRPRHCLPSRPAAGPRRSTSPVRCQSWPSSLRHCASFL